MCRPSLSMTCFFDGWWDYEENVSDHRPVALRIPLAE